MIGLLLVGAVALGAVSTGPGCRSAGSVTSPEPVMQGTLLTQRAALQDPRGRPAILVTHPTKAFIDSLANLRERGLLPPVHFVFLVHRRQKRRINRLREILYQYGFRHFEVVRLRGYPRVKAYQRVVARNGHPFPDRGIARFRVSPDRYLPRRWQKQFAELVDRTDGLLIPGGSNIPASFYADKQFVEGVSTTPVRTLYELSLLSFLLDQGAPYLAKRSDYLVAGFCYGLQALNVALGGTLYQSIPIEVYQQYYVEDILKGDPDMMHRNYHLALYPSAGELYRGWFHRIQMVGRSRFSVKRPDVYVLSNHHQGIKRLGRQLRIVATSVDGRIIEMVRHTRFPNVVAIQGHPERRFAWRRLPKFPAGTTEFHHRFWSQVRRVLRENHRRRMQRAKGRAPQPQQRLNTATSGKENDAKRP